MKKQKSSKPKHQTTPHAYVARVEELEPATDSTPYAGRLKRKLDELRDGRCLICLMICERDNAIRERDEYYARAASLVLHLPPETISGKVQQWRDEFKADRENLIRERDEAREQNAKLSDIAERIFAAGVGRMKTDDWRTLRAEFDQLKEGTK